MKWVGSLSEDCKVPEGSCDMINDSDLSHTEAPGQLNVLCNTHATYVTVFQKT